MARNNSSADSGSRVGMIALSVATLAVMVVAVLVWRSWPMPQMGGDAEVIDTVDALFTAVTSKDEARLSQCEQRLQTQRQAGKIEPKAADALDAVIAKARSGSWQAAAKRLYKFMQDQKPRAVAQSS